MTEASKELAVDLINIVTVMSSYSTRCRRYRLPASNSEVRSTLNFCGWRSSFARMGPANQGSAMLKAVRD